ncbi:polyprotein 1b [Firespike leaf roll-associated virus]|nr:polyprotein 1b [Firespike leaf roll-associated virus]
MKGCRPGRSHFESINFLLGDLFPDVTSVSLALIEDMFLGADMSTIVNNFSFNNHGLVFKPYKVPRLVPRIRAPVFERRQNLVRTNLHVYEQRNFNADRGADVTVRMNIVQEVVNEFFKSYIDGKAYAEICSEPVNVNSAALKKWMDSRTPIGKGGLKRDLEKPLVFEKNLNSFNLMVKADMKPKLDGSSVEAISAGQNISYHQRIVCATFSNVFQQLCERLKAVVKSNILLYHGVNLDEFSEKVNGALHGRLASYKCHEVDLSKYDKSQNALTKSFELEIYRRLGMSEELLNIWSATEFEGSVRAVNGMFRSDIGNQRRTGAANTWIGNTIVNMCLLAMVSDVRQFSLMAFSGDDSLLLSVDEPIIRGDELTAHWGFDAKLIENSVPYFCSKFFVEIDGKVLLVPDPLKLFFRLGEGKRVSDEVLRENFISFCDLTPSFCYESVIGELVSLCERKYGYSGWWLSALSSVNSVRSNFAQFKRCWDMVESFQRENNERNGGCL